jgi:predicted component of type VI protein secretion system
MDINSILNSADDVKTVRMALISTKVALQEAAQDYARAALDAADSVLDSVRSADPCCVVWPQIVEYNKFVKKTSTALNAAVAATGLLLVAEETGNDAIDQMNGTVKVDAMESHVVSALLEGAMVRMNFALRGVPKDGAPGERCNPKALEQKKPDRGKGNA